jgi:fructokinase
MAYAIQNSSLRIGIDLGGTKIEIIALDAASSAVRAQRRICTPRFDYLATLQAIRDLVTTVESELKQTGTVGIGMPGTLSPATGLVKNANSTWLNGRPLSQDLESLLGRPLRFANDADCFALSEATDGAAAGAQNIFGVIIGTGVGGGMIINGRPLTGPNGIAGEWGHNPLPWPEPEELPGPNCYCGLSGCIETWLSGPGLSRDHQIHTGEACNAAAIAKAAASHDPAAEATLDRYDQRLARALASVINILDPEVVVLGGGLSQLTHLYERIPQLWERYVFSDTVTTKLVPPCFGDASGVRGAAWLWSLSDRP